MVLTKEDLDDQDWWNQNVVFTEKNPADGEGTVTIDHMYFHFLAALFQTPHMRDFSQCLLDPIMLMSELSTI